MWNKRKDYSNSIIIRAIKNAGGIIETASRSLGIDRKTLSTWIKKDAELQEALRETKMVIDDAVESVLLHHAIKEKNLAAAIFYLKTRGRNRGYGANSGWSPESQLEDFDPALDGQSQGAINVNVNFHDYSQKSIGGE